MPSSVLFGINNEGRVYTLSTTGSMWRELPYVGQEFKKLSAVPHFLWALGGDHQVYVYVHGLDIPIKVREECYENERWLPIEGFSSRLLPTDRYHFSNVDGTVDRTIANVRMPSMAWQWEGDWQLELTLDGQPLDHNGWTYAVDFPAQYHPKKQWKSCVRRRLWVRTRRYSAMNSWCAIAPLHKDATNEPFVDISIGGQCVAGAEPGTMLVWAVTTHNRVMFRTGVSTKSPEGAKWNHVQTPVGCEVNQVSVGSAGLVWATLLDGRAIVRIGVTRDNLQGESWVEVRSPGDNLRICHLSVGMSAVWAVTQDKQIWFRKGVKGEGAGMSEELAAGSQWVEMVGKMTQISVAGNDQVFAVGADDRLMYHRTGVCLDDLTGKRWRCLRAPLQVSRASSNASLGRDKFHRSLNHLQSRPSSMIEQSALCSEFDEQSHSAPLAPTSLPVAGDLKYEIQPKNPKAWSPVHSVGSIVGTEAHPEADESVWSGSSRDSCIFAEDEELGWAEYEAPWSWVEAGACSLEAGQPPNWFSEAGCEATPEEFEQEWRVRILEQLRSRILSKDKFSHYEQAIDTTSWVHSGEARVNLGVGGFLDCILQLEWIQTTGTLTILNPDGATTMHSFALSDVMCVQLSSEPGHPRLSIHTPRNYPPVVRLQFTSDTTLEEWQGHLTSTCGKLHDALGKPSEESVWAVTTLGDIFIWDPSKLEANQLREDDFYVQKYDLSGKESPINVKLHVGCLPGTIITLTGCVADETERMGINLDAHPTYKLKHKAHADENSCLHFNPRFSENCVVRNSRVDGKWGVEEKDGGNPFKRGQEFNVRFETTDDAFVIFVNDEKFTTFRHRLPPNSASILALWGKMQPFKLVIKSPAIIVDPLDLYWRQIGGHMRRVDSCNVGVTWGIGYDHTAWVYTGGWGGGFYGTLDSSNVHPMTDSQDYRVYENQRWNPVTGYTSAGLPTDRYMWSDASGKQKRTRDQAKLLSIRWQWVSDWMIDFHVPGGVDREGWQYAVDFPASYHANKQFTDYVRRRRWYRRCAVATTGPWQELGHTKLLDVSLEAVGDDPDSRVAVWALASGGQAMVRAGVSRSNPLGHVWEHVDTDQNLTSISVGPFNQVWATGKKGCAYFRTDITEQRLEGVKWVCVEPPSGCQLKQVSCNYGRVWAVDHLGRLHVRREINQTFPEGRNWQMVAPDPDILCSAVSTRGFKQVSVGKTEVWATTDGGVIARREGVCTENPAGSGWDIGISGHFQHVCVRAFR